MLSAEAAGKQLEAWLLKSDDSDDDAAVPELMAAIAKLPKKLRVIGNALFDLDENGKPFDDDDWDWQQRRDHISNLLKPLDDITPKERLQLFTALFGSNARLADRTWEFLKAGPYQNGYYRRAFRAPRHPASTLEVRTTWVQGFARGNARIRQDVATPQWLAIWGSYLNSIISERDLGRFLAATISADDAIGREVFEILCQSIRNEHEIAGTSRMAIQALLSANRAEGWELIERLLLAAQRQEGLRQSIFESVDEAHPEAFHKLLVTIEREKLSRFSAVTRAVNVWCGLNYESDQVKPLNSSITRATRYLSDSQQRSAGLKSHDPEEVYLALWATAYEDAHAAIEAARQVSGHAKVEVRYVTAHFLLQLSLDETSTVLGQLVQDEDLRVALLALDGVSSIDLKRNQPEQLQRFESIERLFVRMPEKPKKLPPIVWPWTERNASRTDVAGRLFHALGDLPPTRMLPYLPAIQSYYRGSIVRLLAEQKKWDQLTRETLLQLTGNASPDVRAAALDALTRVELTAAEIAFIEGLLTRKASDLRIGALRLLAGQKDQAAVASAGRLLASKDALSRLGGLDLLWQLLEADRDRKACQDQARQFADSPGKRTKEELVQLEKLLEAPTERLTLDNALGLLDPANLSPVPAMKARSVVFFSDATVALLKSLDELVHAHREESVKYKRWDDTEVEELLGTMGSFNRPDWDQPPEGQAQAMPLAPVWEEWYQNRPKELRDRDGLELVRASQFQGMLGDFWWEYVVRWAKGNAVRQTWINAFTNSQQPVKLKYEGTVESVIHWLIFLHRPAGVEDFLLDAAETWMALVPPAFNDDLVRFAKDGDQPGQFISDADSAVDWRTMYGAREWYQSLDNRRLYVQESPAQFQRKWKLACYLDRPVPGALRQRPDFSMLLRAHHDGLANLADVTDAFLGPRDNSWRQSFTELSHVTANALDKDDKQLLAELPDVVALADRCRERILEIELARGDTPTPATAPALCITYAGVTTLGRVLRVIGANGFKVTNRYSNDARMARLPTLTEIVKRTFPLPGDTQAAFNAEIKACLQAGLREQTVLELMFLAPQWTKFVEGYIKWPGLSEGLYWFLAHMKYINADAESAATAGGYEADEAEEGKDNRQNQSAWQRLIAERTSLTDEERSNGAIDVEWFHKVYSQLTPKRWEALSAAARFAANPAQAKRATYLGDVLLGRANRKDLFANVTQKKLKDAVRLIGLYPLASGAKRDADLAQRYKLLVDYRRYAKQLSSLTKPAAMQALEIGFRNLASTAGYVDPLRMEWALEADAVKDLAAGPVSAKKDAVVVTLALDDMGRPVVTTEKNGKPLKSVPADVKKDKRVAELLDRVADIRKQASRVKESLEAAMCRGDEFTPDEIEQLCRHALLRPLLERLVLVAGDRAGYPDKSGKSLRDHAGKQHAILKKSTLRLAHPADLYQRGDWAKWQHECFQSNRVQPFKQVFRELYLVTKQERKDGTRSSRYADQQVNPQQANALWNARNWHTEYDVFKAFPAEGITASVTFKSGVWTPLEVEGQTFEWVMFQRHNEFKPLKLADVPARLFSEVMRDLDLVVSVAHRGGVDPEATASTVEMREVLVQETCLLLGLKNVKIKQPRVIIKGKLAEYAVHLGSGNVHRMPGGALCVIPVHAQHRGRLFLPFADDDPRTAEIVSKVLLLAKDDEIQDPGILDQLR